MPAIITARSWHARALAERSSASLILIRLRSFGREFKKAKMTEIKVRRNCPAEFVGCSGGWAVGGELEGEVIRALKEIDRKSDAQIGS